LAKSGAARLRCICSHCSALIILTSDPHAALFSDGFCGSAARQRGLCL